MKDSVQQAHFVLQKFVPDAFSPSAISVDRPFLQI